MEVCPEGDNRSEILVKEEKFDEQRTDKFSTPNTQKNFELFSYKNPKTWKKSITNFFRHQIRSTKSNDGERPTRSDIIKEAKNVSPEKKWQSLGKVFRRQGFVDTGEKDVSCHGECPSHSKRLAVRKAFTNYFSNKSQK
ncbi:hypothetical protein ACJJTC_000115 [Scirpophaga incertulas]